MASSLQTRENSLETGWVKKENHTKKRPFLWFLKKRASKKESVVNGKTTTELED
jgi:hypothetical protein